MAVERSGLHDNWDDPEGYYSKYFISLVTRIFRILAFTYMLVLLHLILDTIFLHFLLMIAFVNFIQNA